jgi:hypothetical protein
MDSQRRRRRQTVKRLRGAKSWAVPLLVFLSYSVSCCGAEEIGGGGGGGGGSSRMKCFFNTNTTQIVDIPHAMSCSCVGGGESDEEMHDIALGRDILGQFGRELVSNVETISIANCGRLKLSSESSEELRALLNSAGVDVTVVNTTSLDFGLARGSNATMLRSLNLINVGEANISFGDAKHEVVLSDPDTAFTDEEIYFYALIGASGLLLLTLIALLTICIFVCCFRSSSAKSKQRSSSSGCFSCCILPRRGKSVSRAASWRYESNLYVNPSERQQRRPGGVVDYGVTSMALQQMMPYQLVPQREATQLATTTPTPQQQRRRLEPFMEDEDYGQQQQRPQPETIDSHKYTDTSLQYADHDLSEYDEADRGGGGGDNDDKLEMPDGATAAVIVGGGDGGDRGSNANSSSYSSTTRTSTLPIVHRNRS